MGEIIDIRIGKPVPPLEEWSETQWIHALNEAIMDIAYINDEGGDLNKAILDADDLVYRYMQIVEGYADV